jgi:NAD(P)-dependent dehydrogenase (short-subunit alcohol dehydrogenase family)
VSPEPSFAGRRVILTGASRGIGLVIARHLAALGATLTLIARGEAALAAAVDSLPGDGHGTLAFDVADDAAWERHAAAILGDGVDGLVTAAGVLTPIGPAGTWEIGAFRAALDTNVTGTLLAILTCLPGLKRSRGAVVTLSGGGATGPLPRFDAYAASKAAVVRLTENLARDLEPSGVRLNAIAPGFVVTEMHQATLQAGPEAVGEAYYERTRRALDEGSGDPPELAAELAALLLSPDAARITGKLVSARWDPWHEPPFLTRLAEDGDFCTLRRIDAQFFDASRSS